MGPTFPLKLLLILSLILAPISGQASSLANDQGLSVGSSCGDNSDCGTGWCDANKCIYPPSGRLFGEDLGDSNSCDAVCRKGVVHVTCEEDKVADCACANDLPSVHCESVSAAN